MITARDAYLIAFQKNTENDEALQLAWKQISQAAKNGKYSLAFETSRLFAEQIEETLKKKYFSFEVYTYPSSDSDQWHVTIVWINPNHNSNCG